MQNHFTLILQTNNWPNGFKNLIKIYLHKKLTLHRFYETRHGPILYTQDKQSIKKRLKYKSQ